MRHLWGCDLSDLSWIELHFSTIMNHEGVLKQKDFWFDFPWPYPQSLGWRVNRIPTIFSQWACLSGIIISPHFEFYVHNTTTFWDHVLKVKINLRMPEYSYCNGSKFLIWIEWVRRKTSSGLVVKLGLLNGRISLHKGNKVRRI